MLHDNSFSISMEQNLNESTQWIQQLFALANEENVPSGILHWSHFSPYAITEFDGEQESLCSQDLWQQLYHELHQGQLTASKMHSLDEVQSRSQAYQQNGLTPIAIANITYHTPKKMYVGRIVKSLETNECMSLPDPNASDQVLDEKQAVLASAILQDRYNGFTRLPYLHYGNSVRWIIPAELFVTNHGVTPDQIEVNFDNGNGFEKIDFDQTREVHYAEAGEKNIQMKLIYGESQVLASFSMTVKALTAPVPNEVWNLQSYKDYNGITATGTAWVYYGRGNTCITSPMIFADGFGSGTSNVNELWDRLSQQSLVTRLLDLGKDVIILGYQDKSAYLQANGQVAVSCILRTIQRRQGSNPLIVAGASMGGLVTRYALTYMEANGLNHQANIYLSFDSPHRCAWVSISLQYFAYYFENQSDKAKALANLLRSPAAQQMLYCWSPAWDYQGPLGLNSLKLNFFTELLNMGNFPQHLRKLAVADGTGNGTGNGVPAGQEAFNWYHACVGARPVIQSAGESAYIGDMWLGLYWTKYYTSNVPEFDGAPGGMGDFYGEAADGAKGAGWGSVIINYRNACFIPSISSLSMNTCNPYEDLTKLGPSASDFDEYIFCSANKGHVEVTPEIANWLISHIQG